MSPEHRRRVSKESRPRNVCKDANLEALQNAGLPFVSDTFTGGVTWTTFRSIKEVPFSSYHAGLFLLVRQYQLFCYSYGIYDPERHEKNILVVRQPPNDWSHISIVHIDAEYTRDLVRGTENLLDEQGMPIALQPGRVVNEPALLPYDIVYASSVKALIFSLGIEKAGTPEGSWYHLLKERTDRAMTLGGLEDELLGIANRPNILPGGIDV